MYPVHVSLTQIGETLHHLQQAGRDGMECVVLWLGRDTGNGVSVQQVHRPDQIARADVFRIPQRSMRALLDLLSAQELMIGAQVHSHPYEAFHSKADDHWAVVRHVDALSLVLPHFALQTRPESFLTDIKAFRLSVANRWCGLDNLEAREWFSIY